MKNKKLIIASILGSLLCGDVNARSYSIAFERWESIREFFAPFNDNQTQAERTNRIFEEMLRPIRTPIQQIEDEARTQAFLNTLLTHVFQNIIPTAPLFQNRAPIILVLDEGGQAGSIFLVETRVVRPNRNENRPALSFHDQNLNTLQQRQVNFLQYRTMRLQRNGFESLDWLPNNLPELRVLNLNDNHLRSLDLPVMPRLAHLQLVGNPLTAEALMRAPWGNVSNLRMLDLPSSIGTRQRRTIAELIHRSCPNVDIRWRRSRNPAEITGNRTAQ